ncbi:hypothetical protein DW66_1363 [Pseudomonas putida]|nr:hypothetical protein DW66_1363 [Pseudomonas putida]
MGEHRLQYTQRTGPTISRQLLACLVAGSVLYRPYRRQAGSHRYNAGLEGGGIPVGAGLPAIGPEQATQGNFFLTRKSGSAARQPWLRAGAETLRIRLECTASKHTPS